MTQERYTELLEELFQNITSYRRLVRHQAYLILFVLNSSNSMMKQ